MMLLHAEMHRPLASQHVLILGGSLEMLPPWLHSTTVVSAL